MATGTTSLWTTATVDARLWTTACDTGCVTLSFEYSNRSDRPPGRVLAVAARLLPGIAAVQRHIEPFADDWERANRAALQADGPLWVALGDSMTQGVGASAYDQGWVGQLSRRLAADGRRHRLLNLSVSGARVQDVLDRQLPAMDSLQAQGVSTALVTVLIGSNDIVFRANRAGVVERFEALLDRLPAGSVVANLPNPHREARQIDAMLRDRQRRGELLVADMRRSGPGVFGTLAPDWFHPNDRGYAAMARVFGEAVARRR